MSLQELIPHLFRTEFRKITAVLCKFFGTAHMELAEDIASETFLSALEIWTYKGLPENPVAWLYAVARNKARNHIRRNQIFIGKVLPDIGQGSASEEMEIDLSEQNIADSQLQMLFAICHPSIPEEAQISLSLRILCGFGIEEIANAFLSNKETVNKRLFRAKEKLRSGNITIEMPSDEDIDARLETVMTIIYLLFNEGYYSESQDVVLREDLCLEAMRLTCLLIENERTNRPVVNALLSLMCFHASRFKARKNENGEMILYQGQDESLWDQNLIERGVYFFLRSSQGNRLSKYHLEAGIAYWHTNKADSREKWDNILQLYNHLLQIEYSPVAALNRTYALSKVRGNREAVVAAEKLQLTSNHFYFALLGELYKDIDKKKAIENFRKAIQLAGTETERRSLGSRIDSLLV